MTLTQLTYVVALDTHGHFGRAAEACRVSQPALSMQIRKLERELGVVLFDRMRSPVVATEVGRMVVEQARVVLREAARVVELREEMAGASGGELRVGVLPTLGPYLLPRFVHALTGRVPGMRVTLEEGLTGELIDRVRNETLDVALIASVDAADLVQQRLFDEPLVVCASRNHPLAELDSVSPRDLPLEDFWLLSEAHCLRSQTLVLCEGQPRGEDHARGIRMESGNLETLMRLVETGDGFTLLPVLATHGRVEHPTARLLPFRDPVPSRPITLVRRRVYLKRRLIDAFVSCMLENLPDSVFVRGPEDRQGFHVPRDEQTRDLRRLFDGEDPPI